MRQRGKLNMIIPPTALALLAGTPAFAADANPDGTSAQEVRREVAEATRAIQNYTVEQRDQAVKKAGDALAALDTRIAVLEMQLEEKRKQMDQAAQQKAIDTLSALRRQRMEIAEWYGGMKHASGKAWTHVKDGFIKSYRALSEAFGQATREF